MSTGHLFVVRGDLTKIAADATMIPTDRSRTLTPGWWSLFPSQDLAPSYSGRRMHVGRGDGAPLSHAERVGETSFWLFRSAIALLPDLIASVRDDLGIVADHVRQQGPQKHGRVRPLIALPLAGTGEGGRKATRGAVVRDLVPVLRVAAADLEVDVALVVWDDQDSAAVQAMRGDASYWTELPPPLVKAADDLGDRAARHDLALFLGAGVSRPLGLPDWEGLVHALCRAAEVDGPADGESLQESAERALESMGPSRFREHLAPYVVPRCTLSHALLAALGLRQAVTTNYDTAFEVASGGARPEGPALKVLTAYSAAPDAPWLLKLHGDAAGEGDLVLTRSQYDALAHQGHPLRGIVQTLLLTTHVLFVGYSMTDETYVLLAKQVRAVLDGMSEPRTSLGTVLPVVRDEHVRTSNPDLAYVPMPFDAGSEGDGARMLEVFLDRLAWTAATAGPGAHRHLLDRRYDDIKRDPAEDEVRELASALRLASPEARRTSAWKVLAQALRDLGADERV